jgi:hypothetical protein
MNDYTKKKYYGEPVNGGDEGLCMGINIEESSNNKYTYSLRFNISTTITN